jgi:transcriptional regulator
VAQEPASLVPGTLEMLILKAVSLGERHGYGILLRLQQMTGGALGIEQGALYPALYRLERRKLLATAWGTSENNRRAKFYRLTAAGRRRLRQEARDWNRIVGIMAAALRRRPGEA